MKVQGVRTPLNWTRILMRPSDHSISLCDSGSKGRNSEGTATVPSALVSDRSAIWRAEWEASCPRKARKQARERGAGGRVRDSGGREERNWRM